VRTFLAVVLLGTGCGKSEPLCPSPDVVLATSASSSLSCGEADTANAFIAVLASREVPSIDREKVYATLRERFIADPSGTEADLRAAGQATAEVREAVGLEAAERRAHLVYNTFKRRGPLVATDDALVTTLSRTTKLWVSDDETELALTERDIEGWLKYGSLCREVQGGGPLKLSIADRVPSYQVVEGLFRSGRREQQVALAAMGPFWPQIKARWAAASYEEQQAWIASAPLPPPMTASSLGYFEAVLEQPPVLHAQRLHAALGPLAIREEP
jgi:hypothetical protein